MDDITARIMIAIETGEALRNIKEIRDGMAKLTEARKQDTNIQRKSRASAKLDQDAIKEEIGAASRALKKQGEEMANVRRMISERGKLSTGELKIERAAANLVTAEYKEQVAALALLRAEYKLTNAERNLFAAKKSKEDPRRILALQKAVEQYRAAWTRAQQAAADTGISARLAANEYAKLTKAAGRGNMFFSLFGRSISKSSRGMKFLNTSAEMLTKNIRGAGIGLTRFGLWGVAAGLAMKNISYYFDLNNEKLREGYEQAKRNAKEMESAAEFQRLQMQWREQAASEALSYQGRGGLNFVEQAKQRLAIKGAGADWAALGLKINKATGALDAYSAIRLKAFADRKKYSDEIAALDREWRAYDKIIKEGKKFTSQADRRVIKEYFTFGNFEDVSGVSAELNEYISKIQKNRLERARADRNLASVGMIYSAALKDRSAAVSRLIDEENRQFQIQRARNRGDEEGAAWMEKRLELQRQINGLTAEELTRYRLIWAARREAMTMDRINEMRAGMLQDQQIRALRERGEFKQADWLEYRGQNLQGITGASAYQAWKNWSANYDSRLQYEHRERLNNLKDELRIEQLLLSGDERRARAAKWQNELKRQGVTAQAAEAEIAMRERLYQARQFRQDWNAAVQRAKSVNSYRFRSTSQTAVFANSVEALRLQSRVLTQSPEMKVQQGQLDTLKRIETVINRLAGPTRTAPTMKRS